METINNLNKSAKQHVEGNNLNLKSTKGFYMVEVPIKYLLLFDALFIFLPQPPPQWEYLQMFVIKPGCPVEILS